jgi:hypothetical protein
LDVIPALRFTDSMQIDTIGRQLEIGDALRTHIGICCTGATDTRPATDRESAPDRPYPDQVN